MGVRWIRLDVTWSQSEWIEDLPPASRLAWIELLCFVKTNGVAGSVKKPSPAYLARIWGLSKSSVEVMLAAASHDEAIFQDRENLMVTGWGVRQSDPKAAMRMTAYRERLKGESPNLGLEAVTPVTRNAVTPVTRNNRNSRERARRPDRDRDSDTPILPALPPRAHTHASPDREDDDDLELEIRKHIGKARKNVIAIHRGTEMPVTIEGHEVGVGIEVDAFKRLCREGKDPPEIIAAAIAHIPAVSELQPPVSLARWGADDGVPIYEQCVGRAYKEVSP